MSRQRELKRFWFGISGFWCIVNPQMSRQRELKRAKVIKTPSRSGVNPQMSRQRELKPYIADSSDEYDIPLTHKCLAREN